LWRCAGGSASSGRTEIFQQRGASHSALTAASAELKWTGNWSVAGTFEGEFSGVTRSYAGEGAVRYIW
jgi:hypothetical protein